MSYHHDSDNAYLKELRAKFHDKKFADYGFKEEDLGESSKRSISKKIQSRLWSSSVTIVLVGEKTRESSWIDWEIWYSLQSFRNSKIARRRFKPKGLLAIYLPVKTHNIPKRLKENIDSGYAEEIKWNELDTMFDAKIKKAYSNRVNIHLIRNKVPLKDDPRALFSIATVKEILSATGHRPWKMLSENWKFYQEWNNAIFLHWQVDLETLKEFVPTELEIDLFQGKPWVSVVAFDMEKIRPKNLPPFPPVSNFNEINIRTYVKLDKKPGVYFLSIEGGKKISCTIARKISELPYRYSKMKRSKGLLKSYNSKYNDQLTLEYKVGNSQENKTELGKWLTERYALFQDTELTINAFEIHHLEWPLNEIQLQKIDLKYTRFRELINNTPDCSHYSYGIKVLAWGKNKKDKTK